MKTELENNGWVVMNKTKSLTEIMNFASSIGTISPQPNGSLYKVLLPNDGESKLKGTFSERFRMGTFPLHTDNAFKARPVHYILLATLEPSLTGTTFLDSSLIIRNLSEELKKIMEQAVFRIKTNKGQYYLPLSFKGGLRFDPTCMIPANQSARIFEEAFSKAIMSEKINIVDWRENKIAVFDNWRILHGREPVIDQNRKLIRININ
ncbi:MAG: TauD/TfdA family dioxygenase [Cytophagales bacterium]|nr:TauD/TfdA family dioxygenase [Cytophagales bacterium]